MIKLIPKCQTPARPLTLSWNPLTHKITPFTEEELEPNEKTKYELQQEEANQKVDDFINSARRSSPGGFVYPKSRHEKAPERASRRRKFQSKNTESDDATRTRTTQDLIDITDAMSWDHTISTKEWEDKLSEKEAREKEYMNTQKEVNNLYLNALEWGSALASVVGGTGRYLADRQLANVSRKWTGNFIDRAFKEAFRKGTNFSNISKNAGYLETAGEVGGISADLAQSGLSVVKGNTEALSKNTVELIAGAGLHMHMPTMFYKTGPYLYALGQNTYTLLKPLWEK